MLSNIPLEISLPEISLEQEAVIHVLTNNNVIVDSVAGSGKTTCSLYIAKRFSEQKILLLTYNSNLKVETREKILKHKIRNLKSIVTTPFVLNIMTENALRIPTLKPF